MSSTSGPRDYHPAVAPNGRGTDVIISLPADGLTQAVRTGLAVVAGVTTAAASAVQAMTAAEWDRRLGLVPVPDLISVTQAAEIQGVSRQAILQRLEGGALEGQKVGTTWVVSEADAHRISARLVGADREEVARVTARIGEPYVHEGVTYVPTGGNHAVGRGGPRVHTYVPSDPILAP